MFQSERDRMDTFVGPFGRALIIIHSTPGLKYLDLVYDYGNACGSCTYYGPIKLHKFQEFCLKQELCLVQLIC